MIPCPQLELRTIMATNLLALLGVLGDNLVLNVDHELAVVWAVTKE